MEEESIFMDWDTEEEKRDESRYVEVNYVRDTLGTMANWSLALGIMSIVFSTFIGLPCAIVSKCLINGYINKGGKYQGPVKGAAVTSTIGLITSILSICYVIIAICIRFSA